MEHDIEEIILRWLAYNHIYAWKAKTQGTWDPVKKVFRKNPRLKKGVADILGILKGGRFLAIEVKKPGGKPSPEQEEFLKEISERGGLAFWADSLNTVQVMLAHLI